MISLLLFVSMAGAGGVHLFNVKEGKTRPFPIVFTLAYLVVVTFLALGSFIYLSDRGFFSDNGDTTCHPVGPYGAGC